MRVVSAESTELFVGPSDAPLQLVRVAVTGCTEPAPIRIHGDGLAGEAAARPGDDVIEVAVAVESPVVGERRTARVHTPDGPSLAFEFTVAEPGWTMFMISHFHYDPVWWNTQGAYTSQWREDPPGRARQANGFELVRAHLEMARREPEYKFVLAEVDYLKPYWDTHPQDRADLRRFLADGRIEVMGGTYNEPNTNLTSPETTIRNLVHGIGFQRDVLGAEPATAWQLDVFGHDPQFPGLAADAGLTSSSWARGPHHQWGPAQGGVDRMQFCSEFEWIAPSGRGLLTHYMPAHYSAGWSMDSSTSLADAEAATYALFDQLKKVALTRNVLLPVGTDYTPPNKWVTAIHRDWGARYTWPRFVCALPKEFFAAVRAELAAAVALRLVQTTGADTPVTIGCELGKVGALRPADLLETPLAMARARKSSIDLHGYQVATVLARLDVAADMANVLAADDVALAPHAETAQPQYARYWLHNRGPAPLGGLPAVAHLHPRRVRGQPGDDVVLRLTAASDCTDSVLGGVVDVVCPLGWPATPARLPFTLGAGAHLQADIALSIPAGAPPGPYPVRAQLRVVDTAVPAAWRQVVEDVCVVTVGADSDLEELVYLVDGPADIELAAGDRARLAVTIGSRAHAELALDAHSISPWGTWEWIGPPALGAVLPARGMAKLAFDVTPPAWLEPGQWWALVRVGCAGQLVYSPAVKVSVT